VCRDGGCANAIADVGWDLANATALGTSVNYLYIRRLPQLPYQAQLRSLALFGTPPGGGPAVSARIALYADNGSGTSPQGDVIGSVTVMMADGVRSGTASPQPTLQANTCYWIAFKLNGSVNVGAMTGGPPVNSTTARYVAPATAGTYGDDFYTFPGTASPGTSNLDAFSVYARVEYLE
jgi:hypothetical protein